MELLIQLMMGISLAAAAGLRAFLPMLAISLAARAELVDLNASFQFLARDDVLIVLLVAAIVEFVGDKIVAVDHVLDVIGTGLRPLAGALSAASVLGGLDPMLATIVGLAAGGGTSLAVHSGKAALRAGVSMFLPGFGNAAVSMLEDIVSVLGVVLAFVVPVVAFVLAVGLIVLCVAAFRRGWWAGRRIFST